MRFSPPASPACSVTIPTLVLGQDPQVTEALVTRLAEIGIVDVDVASGYSEACRRNEGRDYLAVIIAGMAEGSAARDAFCRVITAGGEDGPGVVILDDGVAGMPPCGSVVPALLPRSFQAQDLRRAILEAVGYAGHSCKSAGLCRQTNCHLRSGLQ